MPSDANTIKGRNTVSPRQLRHCYVSCGLPPLSHAVTRHCSPFIDGLSYPRMKSLKVLRFHLMNRGHSDPSSLPSQDESKKTPSLSQHRFWHHCGDGCAFG